MSGVYVVRVEVCGNPITGLRCPDCALPSGIGLVMLINGTPHINAHCHDCGAVL